MGNGPEIIHFETWD